MKGLLIMSMVGGSLCSGLYSNYAACKVNITGCGLLSNKHLNQLRFIHRTWSPVSATLSLTTCTCTCTIQSSDNECGWLCHDLGLPDTSMLVSSCRSASPGQYRWLRAPITSPTTRPFPCPVHHAAHGRYMRTTRTWISGGQGTAVGYESSFQFAVLFYGAVLQLGVITCTYAYLTYMYINFTVECTPHILSYIFLFLMYMYIHNILFYCWMYPTCFKLHLPSFLMCVHVRY